jgi:hypothetical protein
VNVPNLNKRFKIMVKAKMVLGITAALIVVLFVAYLALTCPRVLFSFTVSFTIRGC